MGKGDFLRALEISFVAEGLQVTLDNGQEITAPFTERLKQGTPEQRNNWVFIADGMGIHWPELDEDLNVDELYHDSVKTLLRDCRFCNERSRWNSNTCDNCGKSCWNDPDDTKLGRQLGKSEREDYEIALARVRLDRAQQKLLRENDRQKTQE